MNSMVQHSTRKVSRILLRGLVVMLPIVITMALVYWLVVSAEALLGGVARLVLPDKYYFKGLGVLLGILLVLAAGIGSGYALAISSHFLFEGNRPMIAVNPVWGAFADMRMTWLAATGRLPAELHRHRIARTAEGAASP